MKKILLAILLLVIPTNVLAWKGNWKNSNFKGSYYCVGQGGGFIWEAFLISNGKSEYAASDIVGTKEGTSEVTEVGGYYEVDQDGYVTLYFGSIHVEGIFVQKGKGLLLNNNGSLFTGECWRDK